MIDDVGRRNADIRITMAASATDDCDGEIT